MNYIIIFFVVLFGLMTLSSEAERTDWQTYFEREMKVQDSLWNVIQNWELITYEGDFDIQEGDSIMVKKK